MPEAPVATNKPEVKRVEPLVNKIEKPSAPETPHVAKIDPPIKPVVPEKVPALPTPPVAVANVGGGTSRGLQLIKAGQYASAIEVLKPSVQANPKDEQAQMALGMALFESSEKPDGYDRAATQAALAAFVEASRINDQNAEAFMYAGHCCARLDKADEKSMYLQKAMRLNGAGLRWELRWVLGNRNLKEKDFSGALDNLTEAENRAGKIQNPRLLRDLAFAFHNTKQDAEAIKRVNALWELGYTPDAQLVSELKKVSPDGVKVPESAYANVAPVAPVVPTAPAEIKPDVAVGKSDPKSALVKEEPRSQVPTPSPEPAGKTDVTPPVAANKPPQSTVKDLDSLTPNTIRTEERPRKASAHVAEPIREAPPHVVKPLPAIPESFDAALSAGKRALNHGLQLLQESADLMKQSDDESKQNDDASRQRAEAYRLKADTLKNDALDCWDEAESMFRGAWDQKPEDPAVKAQFKELAKQVGVIALVKSSTVTCKPNGLVVLSAEPSIIYPEDKKMYWVWQQIDGKALDLRREQLDKQMVGLRIKVPGVYKFELVVSDGSRGGNPVSVTVEVR